MTDKTYYRISYGYEGYTHGCCIKEKETALPIYERMKKMYEFCKLELME